MKLWIVSLKAAQAHTHRPYVRLTPSQGPDTFDGYSLRDEEAK